VTRKLQGNDASDQSAVPERSGFGSGGVEAIGVLDSRILPDRAFSCLWDAIVLDQAQKDRLLAQSILNFTVRRKVDRRHNHGFRAH